MVRILFAAKITDEATGYKLFRRIVLESIELESRGFDFCPEFTAKVLRKSFVIHEVPITYHGRNQFQGKKIRVRDGIEAVWILIKWKFLRL